jgi:hypothetical protein
MSSAESGSAGEGDKEVKRALATLLLSGGLLAAQPTKPAIEPIWTPEKDTFMVFSAGNGTGGPIVERVTDAELLDLLHSASIYLSHFTSMKVAEAAFELHSGGTKEGKRSLQRRFDEAKQLTDEALSKVRTKTADMCASRKLHNCLLEVSLKGPRDSRLKGAKQ